MAVGVGIARGPVKAYNAKVTRFVVVSCSVAATGGLIFGYDVGISGGVSQMESFLKKFFPDVFKKETHAKNTDYCKFDSEILTAFTSSLYIAALASSLAATYVTRAFGRKFSMLSGASTFLIGAAINAAAVNVEMLILGRIMLGFGVGFANQAVPIYLSEMAPPKLRGAFSVGFQLFLGIGVLTANLINYGTAKIQGWGWRLSLGLAGAPALIMLIGTLTLPDTPSSLILRGCHDDAKAMLVRLRGTHDVMEELTDVMKACEESRTMKRNALRRILTEQKYRAPLVVAMGIQIFQQFTGINVIAFYAPVLFKTIGFGSNASLMSAVILGVVNVVSIILSLSVVDMFGRRKLLLTGCLQMIVCQVAIAVILATKLEEKGGLSKGYGIALVVLLCLHAFGFGCSWGPLSWLIPSEIFPMEVRSAGQGISVGVQMLMTFLLSQVFLTMLCHMKYGLFFFYAAWVAVMALFVLLLVPETKGIPIEDMSRVWKEHWFWKRSMVSDGEEKSSPTNGWNNARLSPPPL